MSKIAASEFLLVQFLFMMCLIYMFFCFFLFNFFRVFYFLIKLFLFVLICRFFSLFFGCCRCCHLQTFLFRMNFSGFFDFR